MRRIYIVQGVVLLLATYCWPARAGADSKPGLKEDLLRRYAPAAARLEEFYNNVQVAEEIDGIYADKFYKGKMKLRYYANGRSVRVESIDKDGHIIKVQVWTPEVRFTVMGAAAAKGDSPDYHFTDINGLAYEPFLEHIRYAPPTLVFAPYCFLETRILDEINRKGFEVTDLSEQPDGRVTVKFKRPVVYSGTLTGFFVFDSSRSWALVEMNSDAPDLREVLEYGETRDGVPMITRGTFWRDKAFGKDRPWLEERVLEFTPSPADKAVFSPAAFGLPDVASPKPFRWPILLIVANVCLFLSALVLWLFHNVVPPVPPRVDRDAAPQARRPVRSNLCRNAG